jgi:hypothetical protein
VELTVATKLDRYHEALRKFADKGDRHSFDCYFIGALSAALDMDEPETAWDSAIGTAARLTARNSEARLSAGLAG